MWGCSLAAAYGVVISSTPGRYRAWTIGANLVLAVLFTANVVSELHTPIDQSHWKFKEEILRVLLPGEGIWLHPTECPFVAPAGSYYWYAFADQVPFSIAYARTSEARHWLPQLTDADLPPCRMLDAHLHGLPKGTVFVRFIDQRNVANLPQSARCVAALQEAKFARRIGGSPVFEIKRPPPRY
jgi:hypothetical protein